MRFGFFDQLPCASGYTERQRYRDIIAQIELGDVIGFDTAWLGELHFSRAFSILADPLMVLAAAAQRTTRIRLGTAVTLLPLHNPVKVAEQAAIADILSDGRLELGVGRGTAPLHYSGYDVPQEESRERFDEALEFILRAWTNEQFSFEGRHFRARELAIVPRPLQSPHPPIRIAANSPDTFPMAGRRGFPIFATPLINPPDKLREGLALYRDTLGSHPGDTALAFPVHVTTSRAQARPECEPVCCVFCVRPQSGYAPSATPTSRASRRFGRSWPESSGSNTRTSTKKWAYSEIPIIASSGCTH
jgi:alkanesulfonate monooxygenase SsuD/methylene tetrahydromethanopterin reductase-like flavin-dependent oxidoreductase (luciferase family)